MSILFRRLLLFGFLFGIGYGAWRTYLYFFDQTAPVILVRGICQDGYCSANVLCTVCVSDAYKVDTVSMLLDDMPIVSDERINSAYCEKSFMLQTARLRDGAHHLTVCACDAARHVHRTRADFAFTVDNAPLQCALARPENDLKVLPGRVLYLPIQLNKRVKSIVVNAFAKEFFAVPAHENATLYECFIPVDCEEAVAE